MAEEKKGTEREEPQGGAERKMNEGGAGDLQEREYRDAQGNIHHHTHTSGEMREKGSKKEGE
jgi:hypothetical protein